MIRHPRQFVFIVVLGLSGVARAQTAVEPLVARSAKEDPRLSIDDRGFALALSDRSYVLRIRGLVQSDSRFFADSEALQANDTFLIRRLRPTLEGTLFSLIDFRLQLELAATSAAQILDAYVDLHPWDWLRLRTGKMKAPVGLERLQGDADRIFLEQTLVANLSNQRDVGVQLWGEIAGGLVHYLAGIFNGAPDNTAADIDLNHAKDFEGRVFVHPFRTASLARWGNLGIGVSAATGNRKGRLPTAVAGSPVPLVPAQTGLSPFRSPGQIAFFQYLAPATDTTGASTTFAHERATRVNPQLYYFRESIGLLAEVLWLKQGVQNGDNTAELTHRSAAVTASYTINGRENYDGTTPLAGFDRTKRAWGALVIGVRWSGLTLDNATFSTYANPAASPRSANEFGAAITWVPRRAARFGISFDRTRFDLGAGTPGAIADRPTENVVIARAQVNF